MYLLFAAVAVLLFQQTKKNYERFHAFVYYFVSPNFRPIQHCNTAVYSIHPRLYRHKHARTPHTHKNTFRRFVWRMWMNNHRSLLKVMREYNGITISIIFINESHCIENSIKSFAYVTREWKLGKEKKKRSRVRIRMKTERNKNCRLKLQMFAARQIICTWRVLCGEIDSNRFNVGRQQ